MVQGQAVPDAELFWNGQKWNNNHLQKINFGVKQIAADEKTESGFLLAGGFRDIRSWNRHNRCRFFLSITVIPWSAKRKWSFIDAEGNYWISTGNGIGIYNEANQFYKIHQVNVDDKGIEQDPLKIKAMAQTDRDHIWLATNLGLYKYNLTSGTFHRVQLNTAITNITTLCSDGHLVWIGIYDQLFGLDMKAKPL